MKGPRRQNRTRGTESENRELLGADNSDCIKPFYCRCDASTDSIKPPESWQNCFIFGADAPDVYAAKWALLGSLSIRQPKATALRQDLVGWLVGALSPVNDKGLHQG